MILQLTIPELKVFLNMNTDYRVRLVQESPVLLHMVILQQYQYLESDLDEIEKELIATEYTELERL